MKDRILWLDNLRAVAIFFVVLGHTVGLPGTALKLIFSFHMPIFFWLSGVLVKDSVTTETFRGFIGKRWKKRLIPYISFSLISYAAWFFLFRHFGAQAELNIDPLRPLIGMLYGNGINNWLVYNTVLWFFLCLFVTEIFFFFLVKIPSRTGFIAALVAVSILGYLDVLWHPPDEFRLPWNADIALTTVVFFGVGYLSREYVLGERKPASIRWAMTLIALSLYVGASLLNRQVALVAGVYGNYLYFYLAAFSGILFWMQVAAWIPPFRLLTRIGANTLVIFSLHLLVFPFLTAILVYICQMPSSIKEDSVPLSLAYTIISILVLLPVSDFIHKHLPFLIGESPRPKPFQRATAQSRN